MLPLVLIELQPYQYRTFRITGAELYDRPLTAAKYGYWIIFRSSNCFPVEQAGTWCHRMNNTHNNYLWWA